MKYFNLSRRDNPTEIFLGCQFGQTYLDVTGAIHGGAIPFSREVRSIEDALTGPGGLPALEEHLKEIGKAPHHLQRFGFDPSAAIVRAPILNPPKLMGVGLNYRDHAEEVQAKLPREPLLFAMYANAIIGPEEPIRLPAISQQVDYEAELGVVIGSRTHNVSVEDALQYVAGYTIVHDVSARDLQFADKQWFRAKSIDTFAPIGPCLVSQPDLGAADNLSIQLRLNGQTMQQSTTANMIFNVPTIVSHASHAMTLLPGDVIATGTPAGVGFTRKPPVFLKAGDIVEIEIEGIGVLRNPVMPA